MDLWAGFVFNFLTFFKLCLYLLFIDLMSLTWDFKDDLLAGQLVVNSLERF